MDRGSGDHRPATGVLVHSLFRQAPAPAILHNTVVGGNNVPGEPFGGYHPHLRVLGLPTGHKLCAHAAGGVGLLLKLRDCGCVLGVTHN